MTMPGPKERRYSRKVRGTGGGGVDVGAETLADRRVERVVLAEPLGALGEPQGAGSEDVGGGRAGSRPVEGVRGASGGSIRPLSGGVSCCH